jgi:hypothetical protein
MNIRFAQKLGNSLIETRPYASQDGLYLTELVIKLIAESLCKKYTPTGISTQKIYNVYFFYFFSYIRMKQDQITENSHGQGIYLNFHQFRPLHQPHILLNRPELRGWLGFTVTKYNYSWFILRRCQQLIASNDRTINNEVERICKETVVA